MRALHKSRSSNYQVTATWIWQLQNALNVMTHYIIQNCTKLYKFIWCTYSISAQEIPSHEKHSDQERKHFLRAWHKWIPRSQMAYYFWTSYEFIDRLEAYHAKLCRSNRVSSQKRRNSRRSWRPQSRKGVSALPFFLNRSHFSPSKIYFCFGGHLMAFSFSTWIKG